MGHLYHPFLVSEKWAAVRYFFSGHPLTYRDEIGCRWGNLRFALGLY